LVSGFLNIVSEKIYILLSKKLQNKVASSKELGHAFSMHNRGRNFVSGVLEQKIYIFFRNDAC